MGQDGDEINSVEQDNELLEVHRVAMKRYSQAYGSAENQRDQCIEDSRFAQVEGAQWDDLAKQRRANRPRYEINKVQLAVNKVVGDQRQNQISPKVRPAGGEANKKTADVMNGLLRNIENNSKFDQIKNNAFKESVNGGIGAWQVVTEFTDDDSFEQDIRIKPILGSASSVYLEPASMGDIRESSYCFVTEWIGDEEFKERYPGFTLSSMSSPVTNDESANWFDNRQNRVRIADYWVKKPVKKKIAQLTDSRVVEINEEFEKIRDELELKGIGVATTAQGNPMISDRDSHEIVHYKVSGGDVLSGPNPWAGKHIPVVPFYGYSIVINGKHYYRGIIRFSKDGQRVLNYATSNLVETTSLSPKDPYWMTPEMVKGHESRLQAMNVSNAPIQLYNNDPGAPGPPKRTGAPAVNAAMIQEVQMMDKFIQDTTGLFDVSLGDNPRNQSGKAILAQQQQGDSATFELIDNLADAVEYTGEVIIDLMQKTYDTKRQMRIVQPDGETEMVFINGEEVDQQTGEKVIINDLSKGKYDVTVDVAPSFKTQRQEAANSLIEISRVNPQFAAVSGDLLAKNLQFTESPELTQRMRKILAAQGVVDLTEDEIQEQQEQAAAQQPQQPDPMQMMQMEMGRAQLEKITLENERAEAEIEKLRVDSQIKQQELEAFRTEGIMQMAQLEKTGAETEKIEAETAKTEAETRQTSVDTLSSPQ